VRHFHFGIVRTLNCTQSFLFDVLGFNFLIPLGHNLINSFVNFISSLLEHLLTPPQPCNSINAFVFFRVHLYKFSFVFIHQFFCFIRRFELIIELYIRRQCDPFVTIHCSPDI